MPATAEPITAPERPQGIIRRSMAGPLERIRAEGDAEDVHRYEFKASSDAPVEMWGGAFEILDHSPESIRLEWLASGNAPLLDSHNRDKQIGIIEAARIEAGNIIITARIAPSQTDLIKDIEAGIIRNVSIGYRVHGEKLESRETNEAGETVKTVWRSIDWEPAETSLVSLPADRSVGIGRSENDESLQTRVKFLDSQAEPKQADNDRSQPNKKDTMPQATEPKAPTIEVGEARQQQQDAVSAERARVGAINQIANQARSSNLGDHAATASEFIEEGRSVEEFQRHVLDNVPKTPTVTQRELGVSDDEAKRYDLTKVINGLTRGDLSRCGFEIEVSEAMKERSGRSNENIAIPMDVLMRGYAPKDERGRAVVSVTAGGGNAEAASLVDTDLLDQMFIESLRESSPLLGLGVTMLPGLTGDVSIPRELLNPEFYWVGEDTEPDEGDYQLDDVDLSFKSMSARVPFTRQALKQSTPNLESLLTNSLRRGQAIALEKALINGAGTATVPQGILGTPGIGAVSAATLTYSKVLELEESLDTANADTSTAAILTNARGKRRLLETAKDAGSGQFLASREGGQIMTDIGQVHTTNNVPANLGAGTDKSAIIYGNFRSLVVGMWGGLEINRDTATKAATGGVVLRVFSDCDAAVTRPGEFAAIQDLS